VKDETPVVFPPERVRASRQILIGAALFKLAFVAWFAFVGTADGWRPPTVSAFGTPAGPPTPPDVDLPGLLGLALFAAFLDGGYGLITAALQRRALGVGSRPTTAPRLRGWILGSSAAAAVAGAPWWFAFILLNHIASGPVDPVAVLALLGGTAVELWAISTVQRFLIRRAAA
jgi:hypothetical protein